jgi:hypothetical protein
MVRLKRPTGHPCKISQSIHASDEGEFIATPLDPLASLSLLLQKKASCREDQLRSIRAAFEYSCRTLKEKNTVT